MRFLASLIAVGLCAGHLCADIPPPPPPKGMKYVGMDHTLVVEKGVTGYVFVLGIGRGPGAPRYEYSSISLSEKPSTVPSGDRYTYVSVVAVPEAAAKKYATEKELHEALAKRSIEGTHSVGFGGSDTLPTTDKRGSVPWESTITAIDPKKGISVKRNRDGKPYVEREEKDGSNPGENNSADDEPQVKDASTLRWQIAGIFATLAFISMGLWLVRRHRHA